MENTKINTEILDSRSKKFMYNSITTALYQIIVMLTGFITPKIMLDCYGSEINGLISSITQFISYFNLVEAGLAGASVYALYKPIAENNDNKISSIISASKKFYTQAGHIFSILLICLALIYPMFINVEDLSVKLIPLLVLILGVKGTLEFYTLAKYRVLLTADQKIYVISIASIVYTILNMIIVAIMSYLKVNVILVYLVSIVAILARTFILMFYVRKNYSYINYNAKPDTKALNKRWDALFLQILGAVQNGSPVVIATFALSLIEVSIFSIYNMVLTGINGVLSIFNSGLSSSFGDIIARNEIDTLQKSFKEFEYFYYIIITIIYSISMVMIMPFINIYTNSITDVNYNQPIIGMLIILNGFLYNLKTPQGMIVISAGHYKETKNQTMIQAIILIVSSLLLVNKLGISGILIGSCLSNLYRDIDLMFYVPNKITKLSWKISRNRMLWSTITFIFISYITMRFVNVEVYSYVAWILASVKVSIICIILTLISAMLFDIKQFKLVIKRIINMVKN